ncbi:MAG TPA: metallophosphoesterase [Terriglobales bacterium]|nr:metallophosphoesterase [Terriglobales bacterium]
MTGFSISRRRFLGAATTAGSLALTGDAILLEPNHPRLVRQEIFLRRLPTGFDAMTIVQLSDFHYDPYFSLRPIEAAVRMSNELSPDLVVLTGDFVTMPVLGGIAARNVAQQAASCAQVLRGLRARSGIFAALGNHDEFADARSVTGTLSEAGFQVLNNTAVALEREGRRLWLAGVRDVLKGNADLGRALRGVPAEEPVVLLAHEPDFADTVVPYPVDLQLSGHSHGGQVCLPLIGPLYLPKMAEKYPSGLRRLGSLLLYTNVGIGTIRIPARWNCPPEVTLITLRAGVRPG